MEMPGIEPGAFHMQSERSTAELHPRFGQNTLYATCDHMHACNWQQTYVSREQTGLVVLYMMASFNLSDSEKRLLWHFLKCSRYSWCVDHSLRRLAL